MYNFLYSALTNAGYQEFKLSMILLPFACHIYLMLFAIVHYITTN